MTSRFPPLRPLEELPERALVIAPHSDDEIIGCGGALAFHARRGDAVRVLVLTDGAAGDPDATQADIVETRREESRRAAAALGEIEHRFLGLEDGRLAETPDLAARLLAELRDFGPGVVYCPSPQEMHTDHLATARALAGLGTAVPCPVLFFGVNAQVQANAVFDVTPHWPRKRESLECFASQIRYHDLVEKCAALDRARTVNIEDESVQYVEGYAQVAPEALEPYLARASGLADLVDAGTNGAASEDMEQTTQPAETPRSAPALEGLEATAVISTWNKADVVRENLQSLREQRRPFASIVVVDNASTDGTAEMIAEEFPEVRLIRMPHDAYGACETFNIGFASVTTPLVAILDDDITLPPEWLERATERLAREPETTAVLSTKVVEPGMPESYKTSPAINRERYMSTFRGCGSLAKTAALREAGFYDERLFIYGNERDLTCRLLNLGYRVLQYPEVETHHKTPFGIQMGKRSLYFHARNAWLSMIKYAPLEDLLRMPFLVISKVLLRSGELEENGAVTDATGTIGIGKSLRQTPGAPLILLKAALSVLANVPYCLKHRQPVTAEDFELPLQ